MIRVKICGNRSIEEMLMAVQAGADAVGLISGVRYASEDALAPSHAAQILHRTPPFVSTVLVTHRVTAEDVLQLYRQIPASTIQLHDDIALDEIVTLRTALPRVKLIKAVHVMDAAAVDAAKRFAPHVDAVLLDTRTTDRIGGTGRIHDWSISRAIVAAVDKPVILAGGLNCRNLTDAVRQVRPFAVDVNSGVDSSDGSKDPQKVKEFVRLAKTCGDPPLNSKPDKSLTSKGF